MVIKLRSRNLDTVIILTTITTISQRTNISYYLAVQSVLYLRAPVVPTSILILSDRKVIHVHGTEMEPVLQQTSWYLLYLLLIHSAVLQVVYFGSKSDVIIYAHCVLLLVLYLLLFLVGSVGRVGTSTIITCVLLCSFVLKLKFLGKYLFLIARPVA